MDFSDPCQDDDKNEHKHTLTHTDSTWVLAGILSGDWVCNATRSWRYGVEGTTWHDAAYSDNQHTCPSIPYGSKFDTGSKNATKKDL